MLYICILFPKIGSKIGQWPRTHSCLTMTVPYKICIGGNFSCSQNVKDKTMWYPWGIQRLVSTHQFLHMSHFRWGGPRTQSAKSWSTFIFGGGDNFAGLRLKVSKSLMRSSNHPGGGDYWLVKNKVKLQKWAKYSRSLTCSCITQSLTHLCVWRHTINVLFLNQTPSIAGYRFCRSRAMPLLCWCMRIREWCSLALPLLPCIARTHYD